MGQISYLHYVDHFRCARVINNSFSCRFLPNHSYIDAIALGPETLAYVINETIYDKEKYYDFFRWHRYYEFHEPSESLETDEWCEFCAFLNDPKYSYISTVYDNISVFWTEYIGKNA